MASTFVVDDRQQRALLRHYGEAKLDRMFLAAAKAGAKAGAEVLQQAAPIGTSQPLSGIYQKQGLRHGALKASVGAYKIRQRRLNKKTIGYVFGPAGRGGVARHWVTGGTRPHRIGRRMHPGSRANPWIDRSAGNANDAARRATEAVVLRYVTRIPRG